MLWIELVGDTRNSFGDFKAPQLASLLDTYWETPGWTEFSAPTQQKQMGWAPKADDAKAANRVIRITILEDY